MHTRKLKCCLILLQKVTDKVKSYHPKKTKKKCLINFKNKQKNYSIKEQNSLNNKDDCMCVEDR